MVYLTMRETHMLGEILGVFAGGIGPVLGVVGGLVGILGVLWRILEGGSWGGLGGEGWAKILGGWGVLGRGLVGKLDVLGRVL